MIDIQLFFSKRYMLITAAVILVMLLLQFFVMKQAWILQDKADTLDFETKTLDSVFQKKSDTVMKYKKALKFNYDLMPLPVESPTDFYAFIISTVSSAEIKNSEVTKISETKETISFSVKGEANYFSLLELLASFRQSEYMMRLADFNVKAMTSGIVSFSFNIHAKNADIGKENNQKAAGARQ